MNQDEAWLLVCEQDMRKRINGGQKFIEFLASPDGDLSQWNNVDSIASSLAVQWVSSSNFKVSLLGMDILSLMVERLRRNFQLHYSLVEEALIGRLGDQKDQVRDASITLFMNIMDVAASPQYLFERLIGAFSHKVWRVREGVCRLLVATLNRFGAKSLTLSKVMPHLCKLVTDANGEVRDAAVSTIVEIYRHVGDKVRQDLVKKGLPPARLQALYERFDALLQSGDMAAGVECGSLASSSGSAESGYSSSSIGLLPPSSRSNKADRSTSSLSSVDGPSRALSAQPKSSGLPPRSFTSSAARSSAGAVDEESFIRDFDQNLPPVRLYGARGVEEHMTRIHSILCDEKKDWEERTKALKALRAVALAGGKEYDSFYQNLRLLEPALQLNAKDLRSQVVRETTITIGFLSSFLKNQFERSASVLLSTLFPLIPNSAKVMSTSGILAIRTILKHTHSPRLLPVVAGHCSSRTTSIRRHTFAFLDIIFQNWATNLLEKHVALLAESVQKGISDADSDVREESRKSWSGLHQHFPIEADRVFRGLSASQQKLIRGNLSTSSSIEAPPSNAARKKSQPAITTTGTGPRRFIARAPPSAGLRAPGTTNDRFLRSRSDIDPASARRSKMKAISSGYNTFGRPGRTPARFSASSNPTSYNKGGAAGRSTTSQPGSRSHSPESTARSRMLLEEALGGTRNAGGVGKSSVADLDLVFTSGENHKPTRTPPSSPTRKSRIPVSTSRSASRAGSRLGSRVGSQAGSPTGSRSGSPPRYRVRGPSSSLQSAPPMRVLPKGREGEIAFNDALLRKLNTGEVMTSDDDMSDTSSISSSRSSNYTARDGLKRHQGVTDDVVAILQLCQSTSWTERKEGLAALHVLIVEGREFDRSHLKKILEIFNRMFADPHGKVFSLFIEILPDFIANYHEQTQDWLYILLTQLLKKMGSDLLGSVQTKTHKVLLITRDTYPTQLQFNILSRYVIDQTQRPNLKVKAALLHFMLELVGAMEPGEITNSSDVRLALSRVISWTTEPKSVEVRKLAEALVMSIFELNAPVFTMMVRVLPKTFQDGAMKVLQGYRKPQDATVGSSAPPESYSGQRRVSEGPTLKVVSPRGSVGTLNTSSPRGSVNGDERMDKDEIAENFRDITASIHKLRLDSSIDDNQVRKSHPADRDAEHNSPPSTGHPSSRGVPHQLLFDDVTLNKGSPLDQPDSGVADVAFAFISGKDKKRAMDELFVALRGSDVTGGLGPSQQQGQWADHFDTILSGVLGALSTGNVDLRVKALRSLKEMLRRLPALVATHAESVVIHVLEAHCDDSSEITDAADQCVNALCSLLPPQLSIRVLTPLTRGSDTRAIQACLKMVTYAVNRSTAEELTDEVVSNLVPGLLQCYDNTESGVRKAAVFGLVALHHVIGDERLCQHLTTLPGGKMKLLQLYIKRSQANSDPGES